MLDANERSEARGNFIIVAALILACGIAYYTFHALQSYQDLDFNGDGVFSVTDIKNAFFDTYTVSATWTFARVPATLWTFLEYDPSTLATWELLGFATILWVLAVVVPALAAEAFIYHTDKTLIRIGKAIDQRRGTPGNLSRADLWVIAFLTLFVAALISVVVK